VEKKKGGKTTTQSSYEKDVLTGFEVTDSNSVCKWQMRLL
jgi:hypothetical protein